MRAGTAFLRHVCVAALGLAAGLTSAVAGSSSPRRADLFTPPPAVALTGLGKTPIAQISDAVPAATDTPALIVVSNTELRLNPVESDPLGLSWELLAPENRALAQALDSWTQAPEVARDSERRRARAVISAAYAAHGYAPFWTDANGWRESASAAMSRLQEAKDDGLDLRAYRLPSAGSATPGADDELAMSEAVAAYALQARGGRIQPERISRLIGAKTTPPDIAQAIADVSANGSHAGETLQAFNPPQYGYQQLREKLIELRNPHAQAALAEERVAEAVDGVSQTDIVPPAGKSTRARLAAGAGASTSRLEAEIVANMERWRWLPRDMGDERIEVNIPDFELAVVRNGAVAHRTRVIVGKEETPTPIFSNAMQYIIVNPYWNVPQSIIQKEMLPKGGVETLAGRGFKVSYSHGKLVVRQPPGEKNALGRVKFVFPNDYAVYMHDTQTRNLFSQTHRAFSHGCMRVQEPFALAEAVLGPGSGWSEDRVRRLIGGSERYINLSKPLPVHIEYFTVYVDEYGRLVQRGDLYGYSARVRRALGYNG